MKEGRFLVNAPADTVTQVLDQKVWELLTDEQSAEIYSRKFLVSNLHHEGHRVRLRIVHDTASVCGAWAVEPNLEDLFLYYFGQEAAEESRTEYDRAALKGEE